MTLTLMNNGFNEKAFFSFQKWSWDGVQQKVNVLTVTGLPLWPVVSVVSSKLSKDLSLASCWCCTGLTLIPVKK